MFVSLAGPEGPLKTFLFLDVTDPTLNEKDLVEELKSVKFVENVEVIRPMFENLIVDTFFFPLKIHNQRVIILSKSLYEGLIRVFQEQFGAGGSAILYYIGVSASRRALRVYLKPLHLAVTERAYSLH